MATTPNRVSVNSPLERYSCTTKTVEAGSVAEAIAPKTKET